MRSRIGRERSRPGAPSLSLAAAVLAGAAVIAASVPPDGAAGPGSLPPQRNVQSPAPGSLLVASPGLGDPNFVHTVILLVRQSAEGTMGLVLNRRTEIPIGRVFESIEELRNLTAPVFAGGPVSPPTVQALVRSSGTIPDGTRVTDDVHVIGSAEALRRRLADGIEDDRFRLYLGYAGWGAGQLERELAAGGWHVLDAEAGVVFDREPDTLWRRVIRRTIVQSAAAGPGRRPW